MTRLWGGTSGLIVNEVVCVWKLSYTMCVTIEGSSSLLFFIEKGLEKLNLLGWFLLQESLPNGTISIVSGTETAPFILCRVHLVSIVEF
jgi:hypothetical protein